MDAPEIALVVCLAVIGLCVAGILAFVADEAFGWTTEQTA